MSIYPSSYNGPKEESKFQPFHTPNNFDSQKAQIEQRYKQQFREKHQNYQQYQCTMALVPTQENQRHS